MMRTLGVGVLGLIAFLSGGIILGQAGHNLPVSEVAPPCFTLAVGFLAVIAAMGGPRCRPPAA